jgi:hypothetical protein
MQTERDPGLVVRIPGALLGPLRELSRESRIPTTNLVRILLEQALSDPPKWMRDRSRDGSPEPEAASVA